MNPLRKYFNEACERCGSSFWAYNKRTRYCGNVCSVRSNPKPQNQTKYKITTDLLEYFDNSVPKGQSAQKALAEFLGCTISTVNVSAKKIGYVWIKNRHRIKRATLTTHIEQRYARETGCVVCGESRVVEAAHIVPSRMNGRGSRENIIPLCPNHHVLFDRKKLFEDEAGKIKAFVLAKTGIGKIYFDEEN